MLLSKIITPDLISYQTSWAHGSIRLNAATGMDLKSGLRTLVLQTAEDRMLPTDDQPVSVIG